MCFSRPMALGNQTSHRIYVQGFHELPWPPSYPLWGFPAYLLSRWWITLALVLKSGSIPNNNPLCIGSLFLFSCDTQNAAFSEAALYRCIFYVAFVIGVLPSGLVWALGCQKEAVTIFCISLGILYYVWPYQGGINLYLCL